MSEMLVHNSTLKVLNLNGEDGGKVTSGHGSNHGAHHE